MIDSTTYKNTSVGIIPVDWEVKKLGEIGELKNGINKDKSDFGFGFPMVNLMDVFGINKIFKNNLNLGLVNANERDIKEFSLRKGDVLFIRSSVKPSGVGLTTLICDDLENTTYSGFIIRFRDNHYLNFEYKAHCFSDENFRNRLLNKSTISANANINQGALNSLVIPIPPLPEQQKIAEILSTWDAAIDNCKTIIDNLKIRNNGLSQQLLAGKIRPNGFEKANWSLFPIKKIAKDISKKNPSDKDLIVLSCTKYNGLVPSLEYFGRKIYSDDLTTYKIVSKGQFAYATNHIEEGSIGYQSNYDEALISPMYTVFQTDDTVNDNFLFRVLKSTNYIHEYQKRMEGSIDRRGGLRWDEFSKIKVPVPELKEQLAIVEILDKATEELNQCQQKLETLLLQKKGLMQQLLTGKVRVKI
jgi:type I restriction enzyme S subunit